MTPEVKNILKTYCARLKEKYGANWKEDAALNLLDSYPPVRSGEWCKCGNCGFEGYCYGTMMGNVISVPWRPRCEKNNKLTKVEKK